MCLQLIQMLLVEAEIYIHQMNLPLFQFHMIHRCLEMLSLHLDEQNNPDSVFYVIFQVSYPI
jgi:hypothetical protein